MQRGKDRSSGHLRHLRDAEGGVAAVLTAWRIHEADGLARDQQTGGHTGLAQESLELGLWRCHPTSIMGGDRFIQIRVVRHALDEHHPRTLVRLGRELADDMRGAERLVVFW